MGWGYFLDAKLTLPGAAWQTLSTQKTDRFPTRVGWWGMKDKELERRFVDMFGDTSKGFTFAKLVKYFADDDSIGRVTTGKDGTVAIRIARLLSKDMDTDIARGVSALFEAAKEMGGAGAASLANDGTYAGEAGVTVTLAKGKLTRKPLRDSAAHADRLQDEIFGGIAALAKRYGVLEYLYKAAPKKKAASKKKAAPKKAAPKKKASVKKPGPVSAKKALARRKKTR